MNSSSTPGASETTPEPFPGGRPIKTDPDAKEAGKTEEGQTEETKPGTLQFYVEFSTTFFL